MPDKDLRVMLKDHRMRKNAEPGAVRSLEGVKRKCGAAKTKFMLRQKKRKYAEMRFCNDMSECRYCGNYIDLTIEEHLINDCPCGPSTPSGAVNPRRRARK